MYEYGIYLFIDGDARAKPCAVYIGYQVCQVRSSLEQSVSRLFTLLECNELDTFIYVLLLYVLVLEYGLHIPVLDIGPHDSSSEMKVERAGQIRARHVV